MVRQATAWVDEWIQQLPDDSDHDAWNRRIAVLASGRPKEFRDLVTRALGVPPANVAGVFGCAATEEFLMAAQGAVDVVVVSPELRSPDILPMADFIRRSYPATAVIVVREQGREQLPSDSPGVSATLNVDAGPAGLRDVVRQVLEDTRDARRWTPQEPAARLLANRLSNARPRPMEENDSEDTA